LTQFIQKSHEDGLGALPVWTREGLSWTTILRKENNSIRVILHEKNAAVNILTQEEPGIPPYLFYAPRAEIKMRCQSLAAVEHYLQVLYPGGVECTVRLTTKEWALIGALNGAEVPASYRLIQEEPITVLPEAWNSQIYEAGLKTQNYDKGFDRFVRKFDPDLPTDAFVPIVKCVHHEHGADVLFTQENRRCLLLDTLHGLSDDQALWYALHSWAEFQPRLNRSRKEPGQLYFQAVYSHVFEKYWDTLEQPLAHPDSTSESFFTRACMQEFADALIGKDLSNFFPLVDSEASPQCVSIAQ
jgi:hypothetical protein